MPLAVYNQFINGYNDTVAPDNMKDTELRKCVNALALRQGGIAVRKGASKVNAASYAAEVNQLISWPLSDGNEKLLAMVGSDLCLINNDGTKTVKKAGLNSTEIGYYVYLDALYFVDGLKYYVYGFFNWYSSGGTVTIALDDIVKNDKPSSGGGTLNHFYKAKAAHGSTNLGTVDFSNTSNWTDVTDGIIPDDIREVPAYSDVTNDLTPIKRCKYLNFHPTSFRIFATGDYKDPKAIYFSESGYPNYFKAVSKLYPTSAYGPVLSLTNLSKSMLVGYKNGWMVWDGIDITDATWKPVAIPDGLDAEGSIALAPQSLLYSSREGVSNFHVTAIYDDTVIMQTRDTYNVLSRNKVENTIKAMVDKERIKAIYDDGYYYMAYCDDDNLSVNNKVLVLDWETKGFSQISGWQVNCWCKRQNGDILFGSKNYILKAFDGYNDINVTTGAEKAIALDVESKFYSLGNLAQSFYPKDVKRFFLSARQPLTDNAYVDIAVVTDYVTTSIDNVDQANFNESLVWNRNWGTVWGFSELVTQEMQVNRVGLRHQIKFSSEYTDNDILIYAFAFEYEYAPLLNGQMPQTALINDNYYPIGT